ncbi:hypothetical protein GsuE55_03080 [Geobacillus subterraneus]|uniref:Uncharacterized protein n=1 Tax=Geobacillus subterraneus TaxID=129338 RepID=A0A679FLT0_9BACL|nr:hypothetical protein GsuE55_03080 [Geobacillus subterraneus]
MAKPRRLPQRAVPLTGGIRSGKGRPLWAEEVRATRKENDRWNGFTWIMPRRPPFIRMWRLA